MKKFLMKMVWEQIRYKNKKNVPIIVVLVLAMFLILQVFCLFDIYINMTIQDAKESNGSYHVLFVHLPRKEYHQKEDVLSSPAASFPTPCQDGAT